MDELHAQLFFIVNIRTASLYPTGKTCDFLNLVRTDNTRRL